MMNEIEQAGISIPPFPLQGSLTTKFRKLAQQNNDSEYTTLWAGQGVEAVQMKQTKELFLNLIKQYEALYTYQSPVRGLAKIQADSSR